MPLHFSVQTELEDEGALQIPYPPDHEDGRTNGGFIDVRGKPDLARKLAEAAPSPALQDLLVAMAQPNAPYFTVGCDLGAYQSADDEFHAGGYVQLVHSNFVFAGAHTAHEKQADRLRVLLEGAVCDRIWTVEVVLSVVALSDIGGPAFSWSYVVHYDATGATIEEASYSAEAIMRVIAQAFS